MELSNVNGQNPNVTVNYVPSNDTVLFDMFNHDSIVCNNFTLDAVRDLLDALQAALEEAKRHEKKIEQTQFVVYRDAQYVLPAGIDASKYSETMLKHNAILIVEDGKVTKNRGGIARG